MGRMDHIFLPQSVQKASLSDVVTSLSIQRLDRRNSIDVGRWDAFVMACPQATFFHRLGWQVLFEDIFGHDSYFCMRESGGVIRGYCPGACQSRLFGKALTSLPFSVYGGGLPSMKRRLQRSN